MKMFRNSLFAAAVAAMVMCSSAAMAQSPSSVPPASTATPPASPGSPGSPDSPATPAAAAPAPRARKMVKVRLLADCSLGKCNEVVEVEKAEVTAHDEAVKAAMGGATFDASPAAVAYAESLSAD